MTKSTHAQVMTTTLQPPLTYGNTELVRCIPISEMLECEQIETMQCGRQGLCYSVLPSLHHSPPPAPPAHWHYLPGLCRPCCNLSVSSFMHRKSSSKPNCYFSSPSVSFINNHVVNFSKQNKKNKNKTKQSKETKSYLCLSFLTGNSKLLMVLKF